MPDTKTSLGIVMPRFSGKYSNTKNYEVFEVILFDHDSFISKKECKGIPPTNETYWQRITDIADTTDTLELFFTQADAMYTQIRDAYERGDFKGAKGDKGDKGDTGAKGDKGDKGDTGAIGPTGLKGDTGATGAMGPEGAKGEKGDTGPQGMQGEQGPAGPQGLQGLQGNIGPQGVQGERGPTGPQGPKGDKGDKGDDGASFRVLGQYDTIAILEDKHPDGVAGDAYSVGIEYPYLIYVWSVDTESWESVGPLQGPKGEDGSDGATGPEGPQGTAGSKGDQGPEGPQGIQGPPGIQGLQGPKGDKGDTGPQGLKGDKGDTGAAGSTGAKGDKGDKGDTGLTGPAGPGLPTGGTDGQVVVKDGTANYATRYQSLTAANVGLGNVNNTSDASKPVSTAMQTALDAKVPTTRTVNGKALSANITLVATDVSAVPTTRTVNGKALSADITLAATDVGLGNVNNTSDASKPISTATQTALDAKVPTTRTVNGKALSANITLAATDVNAVPTTRTVNGKALSADITLAAADVSAVPTTRTVNGKALSADITLAAADVSAVPTTRTVNGKALSANVTLAAADVSAVTLTNGKADPAQISAAIVSATANKTLALTDAGCYIEMNSTSALTVTIPADATVNFPIGTEIEISQEGTGAVTIAAASGVTLQSLNSLKKIAGQYGVVALKKRAANNWRLAGALA